ncbi:amidohydrolase family protein [Erythrobacter sp. AP23]|uniref:metal-dependent hydrolase family protein n=1 Tax=Erythrobacter sp. AP23 TaxID=499656 RepID=UPI00076C0218|nr:amidohydrolase family protein [Erythrobacter sp. AP23]KWV92528.1 hypothetical protein ASS64_14865 [Erythrobacter sp. AP23]
MKFKSLAAILLAALSLHGLPKAMAQEAGNEGQAEQQTIILAGNVLRPDGLSFAGPATITVRDGQIASVVRGISDTASLPDGVEIIDLSRSWVLPGLVDSHVHITTQRDESEKDDALNRTVADRALRGAVYAERTLQAGFTTIRNLGGGEPVGALKDAINDGSLPGPTIIDAGSMISITAGHGDVNGYAPDITTFFSSQQESVCDGADDCRRAVRSQIRAGADVIKFAATGGVNSNVAGGLGQQMFEDEMSAIIETAHMFGRKVAAHAHGKSGIDMALRLGVDSIEHGTFADAESIRLFRQSGAYLVPTLLAPTTVLQLVEDGKMSPATEVKIRQAAAVSYDNLGAALRAGVKIAFGTDSGVSAHGINAQEFAIMVRLGMSPEQAIQSATVNAADLLGISDRIGSIEQGKDADIIAIAENPLENIRALENVSFVMRRGIVHRENGRALHFSSE